MNECLLFIRFLIMYGIQFIVCSLDYKVEISVCHIYWPDLKACMLHTKSAYSLSLKCHLNDLFILDCAPD